MTLFLLSIENNILKILGFESGICNIKFLYITEICQLSYFTFLEIPIAFVICTGQSTSLDILMSGFVIAIGYSQQF